MKLYLRDTPLVTALFYRRPPVVSLVRPWLVRREATTSIVIYGEVVEYLKRRPAFAPLRAELVTLMWEVVPYRLTYAIMERYADIRRQVRPPYGSGLIGDMDTLVAATALVHNVTLVTTDSDFTSVPDLNLLLLDRATFAPRFR